MSRAETSAKQTGLHISNFKTEYSLFNQGEWHLKALNGESLKNVDDLCLGSWIDYCSKDVNERTGKGWSALHKLDTIWKKNELSGGLKIELFKSTVETVLLHGSTAWTLTQSLDKRLDRAPGIYKSVESGEERDLATAHCNEVLYAGLPRITATIRERRLRFSGLCWRSKNEVVSDFVLWEPKHGKKDRWRTGSHICRSAGGGHRGPQRLLASNNG